MEKEFITYEQALALKELGFDESTYTWRQHGNGISGDVEGKRDYYNRKGDVYVALPTYSQAFRWFREAYSLLNHLTTHLNPYGEDGALEESYGYRIMFNKDGWKCDVWEELIFDTHEEAELACLAKLIEIAKEQKQKKTSV